MYAHLVGPNGSPFKYLNKNDDVFRNPRVLPLFFVASLISQQTNETRTGAIMDPKPASMWSSIVKKDPPAKPPTTDVAPSAILGMVGNCKSTKGISVAVVDANAVIDGSQSLTNFADKFVTVPEVLSEIRDPNSRRRLEFIPFVIETMEPSPESLSKGKAN